MLRDTSSDLCDKLSDSLTDIIDVFGSSRYSIDVADR